MTRPLSGTVATLSCPSSYFILNAPGLDSRHFVSVSARVCLRLVADFDSRSENHQHLGEIFIFIKMMCDIFSSCHRCAGAGLRLAAVTVSDS